MNSIQILYLGCLAGGLLALPAYPDLNHFESNLNAGSLLDLSSKGPLMLPKEASQPAKQQPFDDYLHDPVDPIVFLSLYDDNPLSDLVKKYELQENIEDFLKFTNYRY